MNTSAGAFPPSDANVILAPVTGIVMDMDLFIVSVPTLSGVVETRTLIGFHPSMLVPKEMSVGACPSVAHGLVPDIQLAGFSMFYEKIKHVSFEPHCFSNIGSGFEQYRVATVGVEEQRGIG